MSEYLNWKSDLSLEQVFADGQSFSHPTPYKDGILYLTTLKQEAGRIVLNYQSDKQTVCLTPKPFSLRTKINEYGGKPYWLHGDDLWFVNQKDQCVYRQSLIAGEANDPIAVTKKSASELAMFAEVSVLDEQWMIAVVETDFLDDQENSHSICVFDSGIGELKQIVNGADFYSNLVVNAARSQVAWLQWNHPSMPWDDNELWLADLDIAGTAVQLNNRRQIDLGTPASCCQLLFANNGRLFFSADFADGGNHSAKNYWNVLCFDPINDQLHAVTDLEQEFGYPHWQYGDSRVVQFDADSLITFGSTPQSDTPYKINQRTLEVETLSIESLVNFTVQNMGSNGTGRLAMVLAQQDAAPILVELVGEDLSKAKIWLENSASLSDDNISCAEHITFATRNQQTAYGFYYPPVNTAYSVDSAPPLIVMVHGGPTSRAYGYFDIQKQFWTNRGFAILDVNHRGSSGYGRAYRDALYGEWGERDASDIVDGVQHLINLGKADASRICIRGKSAGGYAVLRALTEYPEMFRAGACYYGIGNLATLAEVTHKFEKYYTDRLIGEAYNLERVKSHESLFYQRSPSHNLTNVKSAMIIFQGLQDNIVPPEVAREVVNVLNDAGITHSYVEYPDEGHGFRQVPNNIDALSKELAFYKNILST